MAMAARHSIGYSSGYYDRRYGGYGYGYGSPYYGWYDNYYYPGTGYYVYDTYRRPHAMTTRRGNIGRSRSPALRTSTTTTTSGSAPTGAASSGRT